MYIERELKNFEKVLKKLREENKILLDYLFGSFASGKSHTRSDIDLAIYINASEKEAIEITDEILMSTEREIEILRLDDEEKSPFIIQQALKGIPLLEPHLDTLYNVAHKALHEAESIRFKREHRI
jgi:predicted nucleotidyltransferase